MEGNSLFRDRNTFVDYKHNPNPPYQTLVQLPSVIRYSQPLRSQNRFLSLPLRLNLHRQQTLLLSHHCLTSPGVTSLS